MKEQLQKILNATPRDFRLRLSDSDLAALAKKAAIAELSIEELLEGFIGDFIDGTYGHGSEEQARVQNWFDCCGFERLNRTSLLHFLLSSSSAREFADTVKKLAECTEKLNDTKKVLTELQNENIPNQLGEKEYSKYLKWEIKDYEKEKLAYTNTLDNYWNTYLEWTNASSPDREKETDAVLAWLAQYGTCDS